MRLLPSAVLGIMTLSVVAATANSQTLVDYYEFQNNGLDSAGGDANGTLGANVGFTTGVIDLGASFGTSAASPDDRIDVPQANAFNPGAGDFSIAFWAQRNNVDTGDTDGILDALSGTTTGYQMQFIDTNVIRLRLDDQTGSENALLDAVTAITDSDFHHYAYTIDRTNDEARIYIDGMLDVVLDFSANGLVGTISPSQDLQINGINANANSGMEGVLDELRFYTGVLSADQVRELATATAVPEPSSIALWSLIGASLVGFGYRRRLRSK